MIFQSQFRMHICQWLSTTDNQIRPSKDIFSASCLQPTCWPPSSAVQGLELHVSLCSLPGITLTQWLTGWMFACPSCLPFCSWTWWSSLIIILVVIPSSHSWIYVQEVSVNAATTEGPLGLFPWVKRGSLTCGKVTSYHLLPKSWRKILLKLTCPPWAFRF